MLAVSYQSHKTVRLAGPDLASDFGLQVGLMPIPENRGNHKGVADLPGERERARETGGYPAFRNSFARAMKHGEQTSLLKPQGNY